MGMMHDKRLLPCPICGKKAVVEHYFIDGFEFGWDAGCPSFRRNDGVHGVGIDDGYDKFPRVSMCNSKEEAIDQWNVKAKYMTVAKVVKEN